MHMKKCITIHVLLGNIRPRFRYRNIQILWSYQEARPLDLHQDSTMELLGRGLVAPPFTQMYCAMAHGHCMLCLRHDTSPRPRGKTNYDWGRGAPLIGLPPQQLYSHHATTFQWLFWCIQ